VLFDLRKRIRFINFPHFSLNCRAKHGTVVYDKKFNCLGEDFDDACGSHDFIEHERLFKKQNHIPEGQLTVSCEVEFDVIGN
jgi:hypothetical protein